MNINITYNKESNNWRYQKVCDRCKKQVATVIRDDRKPTEKDLYICDVCSSVMFINEQMREYCWVSPKDKLPAEGQEVEFIATYIAKHRRFQGHFQKIDPKSNEFIFYAHSIGWGKEFLIEEVEYWKPQTPMPEEKMINKLKAMTARDIVKAEVNMLAEPIKVYLESEVNKSINNLKVQIISMFKERRYCIGFNINSTIGQIANVAYKHWNMIEQTRIDNATLKRDKAVLSIIAQTLRTELNQTKKLKNLIILRQKHKRCLKIAELCCERKENCYNIALRKYTKSEADLLVKKSEFWEEWEDTWTQLAYRFNETYNENKNQEE